MEALESLPETGFASLDEGKGPRRAPRSLLGLPVLKDPTITVPGGRGTMLSPDMRGGMGDWRDHAWLAWGWGANYRRKIFYDIDRAYNVESYIRQGIDKFVELVTKHGYWLDCETQEPIRYLTRRFQLMGLMTKKSMSILVDQLVLDFTKYGNAFWLKRRGPSPDVPGIPKTGAHDRQEPILGYFRLDPKRMFPIFSADGTQQLSWDYRPLMGEPKNYPIGDVIHFPFNVQAGTLWGNPGLLPVLEDARAYRQAEEYVLRLLYKHLNPLVHHEVPDLTGTGSGRQEDVDRAALSYQLVAPDGLLVTPPGHKIQILGAENHALRAEGYMKMFRERMYAGLNVNAMSMGESAHISVGTADVMTVVMHNRAKLIQRQLADILTEEVLYELLMEAGYDPTNVLDDVRWKWIDMETEALLAKENHELQKWLNGVTTLDEVRRALGMKGLPPEDYMGSYVYMVRIPEIRAQGEVKGALDNGTSVPSSDPQQPGGAAGQSANRARPANQHGIRPAPKIRPSST
jgi:hypothetical protein